MEVEEVILPALPTASGVPEPDSVRVVPARFKVWVPLPLPAPTVTVLVAVAFPAMV